MLGPYRDRVIVELATNAADAAAAASTPGRLLLRLTRVEDRPTLVVANTGVPLDADGVAGLASLRASGKPAQGGPGMPGDREVGRFGIGFAAVLTVSDEPVVASTPGAVGFSAARTRELVTAEGISLGEGHLPVLRLPFPADARPPAGYETAVLLPLRDDVALAAVRRQLDLLADPLLLALPALAEVEVNDELAGSPPIRWAGVQESWISVRRSGRHAEQDLADRPWEERSRPHWNLTWAVPRAVATSPPGTFDLPGDHPVAAGVVHAPTPSEEPLRWPAVLIADLPLDPGRRHVQPGAATDRIVREAADAYADLVVTLAASAEVPTARLLSLLPDGTPAGWIDAALRLRLAERLPDLPCLRAVGAQAPVRPRDAVVLEPPANDDPAIVAAVAEVLAGVIVAPTSRLPLLHRIGVRRTDLAEVVEAWPESSPGEWATGYARLAALAGTPQGREALARLPVPLQGGDPIAADGPTGRAPAAQRVRRGVRGLLLPDPSVPESAVTALAAAGLPIPAREIRADPTSVDLLVRLGARPRAADDLLSTELVVRLCSHADDLDDPEALSEAVLDLLERSGEHSGSLPWLGDLLVPDSDGDLVEAALLTAPGSAMSRCLDPEAVGEVDGEWIRRWPLWAWQRLGVAATGPVLVEVRGAPVGAIAEADGLDDWLDELGGGGPEEYVLVRDLDLIEDHAWPDVVALLRGDPLGRRAWDPVRSPGSAGPQPSHLVWWLRDRLRLAGCRVPGSSAPGLAELPEAPGWTRDLPVELHRQLGLVTTAADVTGGDWSVLLGRAAPPSRPALLALWRAMSVAGPPAEPLDLQGLWALGADGVPVRVAQPVIPDDARWMQRTDLGPMIVLRAGVGFDWADALDLEVASERAAGVVTSTGMVEAVPGFVHERFPECPAQWHRHLHLTVDGFPVRWWVDAENVCHAVDLDGLGDALAYLLGTWRSRFLVSRLLRSPDDLLDDALDAD